jgi:HSP20 family protein
MEEKVMITRRFFNFPTTGWHNPFVELERMSRQMDQLSSALIGRSGLSFAPARVFPAVNITEDKHNYYLRAELPSIKADDINMEVSGRSLSIYGERKIKAENDDVKYHRREREAGKFSRIIELPGDINPDEVQAKMIDGILTVTISKSEAAKPRQIAVN